MTRTAHPGLGRVLARAAGVAPRPVATRRLGPAACAGLVASALLALAVLGPLPASAFASSFPWVKLGYAGALALAAGWLAARASMLDIALMGVVGALLGKRILRW